MSDVPLTGKRPNATDVYVGGKVRMRRKMLGLSQEKLGDLLGITFQQIQKYEKGTNRIGASRLQAMAKALDVPISFFFPDEPVPEFGMQESGADYALDFMSSSEGLEIGRAFTRIRDPKVRRKLVDLIRAIAESNQG